MRLEQFFIFFFFPFPILETLSSFLLAHTHTHTHAYPYHTSISPFRDGTSSSVPPANATVSEGGGRSREGIRCALVCFSPGGSEVYITYTLPCRPCSSVHDNPPRTKTGRGKREFPPPNSLGRKDTESGEVIDVLFRTLTHSLPQNSL